jgi:large repetitive protein
MPITTDIVFVCNIDTWDPKSHFGDCGPAANNTLPPGNYTFTAHFQGTGVLAPSDSNNVTVTVNEENSTLSPIPASSLTMTYGSETADHFNFTVSPQFANTGTAPSGTVDVFFAGGDGLCNATLDNNGSGSCSVQSNPGVDPDIELNAGTASIEAAYSGDGNFNGDISSDSSPVTLTINQEASNTALVVPSDVKSGNSDLLTAIVTPTTKGTPGGFVDFLVDGQTICNHMPIGDNQTAVCPSGSLSPGSHTVTAHYDGNTNFAASGSVQTFTVTAPAAVNLTVSTPSPGSKATYGREQNVHLNVNVTSAAGGTPSGTVDVFAGSNRLCTITLASAAGQCSLSPAKLKPGSYHLTASYSGDTNFTSATTPGSQPLTITREPAITALTLKLKSVTVGHENSEHLTVTVKPKFAGRTPTGKVTIKATRNGRSVTICSNLSLVNGKASCTIARGKLRPGTYHLTATYGGSTFYTGSTSPISSKDTLTVKP